MFYSFFFLIHFLSILFLRFFFSLSILDENLTEDKTKPVLKTTHTIATYQNGEKCYADYERSYANEFYIKAYTQKASVEGKKNTCNQKNEQYWQSVSLAATDEINKTKN